MTKQPESIFHPREPKGLDSPTEIAMHHVNTARDMIERGQYMRAAAHGTVATATILIAWTLGDPSLTPTIPCTPAAVAEETKHHDEQTVTDRERQRSGVPVIHAETQEEAWNRLRR